jgi:hypothetical protein
LNRLIHAVNETQENHEKFYLKERLRLLKSLEDLDSKLKELRSRSGRLLCQHPHSDCPFCYYPTRLNDSISSLHSLGLYQTGFHRHVARFIKQFCSKGSFSFELSELRRLLISGLDRSLRPVGPRDRAFSQVRVFLHKSSIPIRVQISEIAEFGACNICLSEIFPGANLPVCCQRVVEEPFDAGSQITCNPRNEDVSRELSTVRQMKSLTDRYVVHDSTLELS